MHKIICTFYLFFISKPLAPLDHYRKLFDKNKNYIPTSKYAKQYYDKPPD